MPSTTPRQTPTTSTPLPLAQQPPMQPQDLHEDVDLSCESVAGEEDPGASLDLSAMPGPAAPAEVQPGAQKVPA